MTPALPVWLLAIRAHASADPPPIGPVLEVEGTQGAAPTGGARTREALARSPAREVDGWLRVIPGVVASAHGGRGKGLQILVRGVDAVHGGDLAVRLDGVPLNEVGHPHHHGYVDLGFLPRAAISGLRWSLGPGAPSSGDFGTAATMDLRSGPPAPGLRATLGAGTDRSGLVRGEAARSGRGGVVAEVDGGAGAGPARAYGAARLAVMHDASLGEWDLAARLFGGMNQFDSPGVLPVETLAADRSAWRGAGPGAQGGDGQRVLTSLALSHGAPDTVAELLAWGGLRAHTLTHNFTGWSIHPTAGDAQRQALEARSAGGRARVLHAATDARVPWHLDAGTELRVDAGTARTGPATASGAWREAPTDTVFGWSDLGLWAGGALGRHRAVGASLRADHLRATQGRTARAAGWVLAPRAQADARVGGPVHLDAAWARGFRSLDPAGPGLDGWVGAPARTMDTAELGVRVDAALGGRCTVFQLDSADELVFDHASARYLSAGATRRRGVEAELRWQSRADGPSLSLEPTFVDARRRPDGDPVPNAPRQVLVARAELPAMRRGRLQAMAGLRATWLGPRSLAAGLVSPSTGWTDAVATVARGDWLLEVVGENVLFQRSFDGVFAYPADWSPGPPNPQLPRLHATAAPLPSLRLSLTWSLRP